MKNIYMVNSHWMKFHWSEIMIAHLFILIIYFIFVNSLCNRHYLKRLEALQVFEEIYFLMYICLRFHMKNIYK